MSKRFSLTILLSILFLYILDQVSKWYIVFNYKPPFNNRVREITSIIADSEIVNFNIIRIHNSGVAFGMGNGTSWAPIVFLAIQLIALVGLVVLFKRGVFNTRLLKIAWTLIMTGVLGNMTDRLIQGFFLPGAEKLSFLQNLANGYVVDFLDFSFPWIISENYPFGYHWPSFNVADSCISIAAVIFLLSSFFPAPAQSKDKQDEIKTV